MRLLAPVMALLLLLSGCGGDEGKGRLDGSWNGVLATSAKNDRPGVERVELSVFGKEMTGSDGCSMIKTNAEITDGRLVVSNWVEPDRCSGYQGKVQSFVHDMLKSEPEVQFSDKGQTMKLVGEPGELTLKRR